jgi:hypothetical protein
VLHSATLCSAFVAGPTGRLCPMSGLFDFMLCLSLLLLLWQAAYTPFRSALSDELHLAHALYEIVSIGQVRRLDEIEAYMTCRWGRTLPCVHKMRHWSCTSACVYRSMWQLGCRHLPTKVMHRGLYCSSCSLVLRTPAQFVLAPFWCHSSLCHEPKALSWQAGSFQSTTGLCTSS